MRYAAFSTLIVAFVAWCVVRMPPSDAAGSVPAPQGLPSMAWPHTTLMIQNLEADRAIDMVAELRRPNGELAQRIELDGVPPLAPRAIEMETLALPVGAYSAVVTGTGRVAAVARYAWERNPEEDSYDLALTSAAAPAGTVIVPYVSRTRLAESGVVVLQNPDRHRPTEATVTLVAFGSTTPSWSGRVSLPAAGSEALDLANRRFDTLPDGFEGHAVIEADRPISAMAFVQHTEIGDTAIGALEAAPAASASPRLFGAFSTEFGELSRPNRLASTIALVNPGSEAVDVQITFHPSPRTPGGCASATMGPHFQLAAGEGRQFVMSSGAATGLPPDCYGLAQIESSGPGLIGAFVAFSSPGESYAMTYLLMATESRSVALPAVSWRREDSSPSRAGRSSVPFAYNPGAEGIEATLAVRDPNGRSVTIPDTATGLVDAQAAYFWNLADEGDIVGAAGVITSEAPILGYASQSAGRGNWEAYTGTALDTATNSAALPFIARPPVWPTTPPGYTVTPTPATPAPTSTPVTVVPPVPGREPTLPPPPRIASFGVSATESDGCCTSLAWLSGGHVLASDRYDGVGWSVKRYDESGRLVAALEPIDRPERIAVAQDDLTFVLGGFWGPGIDRFDAEGQPTGAVYLPQGRRMDIKDFAVAPDGTIWLIDNDAHEVYHVDAEGGFLNSWSVRDALRWPMDGAYRIAVSPDGSIAVLSWTRILRYTPEGRLLVAIGGTGLDAGLFEQPLDLKVDSRGRIYVLEATGQLMVLEATGELTASWNTFDDPAAAPADYTALALSASDRVAVADQRAGKIHVYDALTHHLVNPTARILLPSVRSGG